MKKYLIGFIIGFSFIVISSYASNYGSIGSLFEFGLFDGNSTEVWRLDGENIKDGTISTNEIGTGAVNTIDIADNAIENRKLATGSVDSSKIDDYTIDTIDIADNAIENRNLLFSSVDSSKIENGTIDTIDIADNAIENRNLATGSVDSNKIENLTISTIDIANNAIENRTLATDSVDSSKIENLTIATIDIADNAIENRTLATDSVDSSKIENLTIATIDIADNAIIANKLATGSVDSSKILDENVTPEKIDDESTYSFKKIETVSDLNVGGNLNVTNSIFSEGGINTEGALNVGGIANIGGTTNVGGNLTIDGTISFSNPQNVPWTNAKTNLPFSKFGGISYMKDYISGTFNGQITPLGARNFIYYEDDGTLVVLRTGFDGIEYGLYYAYNTLGNYDDLVMTNMRYKPAFLEGTGEYVQWFIDGNEESLTVRTLKEDGSNGYYIIKVNTLDPSTHTSDNVIDITSIISNFSTPSYASCVLINEIDKISCIYNDRNTSRFYLFNDNDLLTPIIDGETIFKLTDTNYIQAFSGSEDITSSLSRSSNHTQRVNIQYYLDGNDLYIQQLIRPRFISYSLSISRTFMINSINKIDLNSYDITPHNTLPMQYDLLHNVNLRNDFSIGVGGGFDNYKPYIFSNKKEILVSEKYSDTTKFTIKKFSGLNNYLEYFEGFRSLTSVKDVNGDEIYVGSKTYIVKDASYLGKTLYYTKFIDNNSLITYSYSNLYGLDATYNWVKVDLPNSEIGGELDGLNILNTPNSITKIDNWSTMKLQTTSLDINGDIIGYNIESGLVNKWDGEKFEYYKTLPSDYKTTILNDISSDPDSEGVSKTVYYVGVINDDKLLVSYAFLSPVDPITLKRNYKAKFTLYNYDENALSVIESTKYTLLRDGNSTSYNNIGYFMRDVASYNALDGNIYFSFATPYYATLGGNNSLMTYVKLDSSGNIIEWKGNGTTASWNNNSLGIHPTYGPYYTNNRTYSRSRNLMYYQDETHETVLDKRIVNSFEAMLNGSSYESLYDLTVRQAEGFILYTGEVELFMDGVYTKLNTSSYDLTKVENGLVNVDGEDEILKNKTIYVTIDNSDLLNPKLKFSFIDIGGNIAIINTDDYGIINISIIDGLEISASETYINTIVVKNYIKIKGGDGNWYKVYVGDDGLLKTELFVE